MGDEQDELAALYGNVQDIDEQPKDSNILGQQKSAAVAAENEEDLFAQLYGDQPEAEEPVGAPSGVFDPYAAAKMEEGRQD